LKLHVLALLALSVADTTRAQTPFTLSLVPSQSVPSQRGVASAASRPDTFYVVVTNVSEQPHAVWALSNSWGYRSLSLEMALPNGTTVTLFKKPQRFTRNIPRAFLIPPHEHQVFPIRLDSEWQNRPTFPAAGSEQITLRVIYEVAPSAEATDQAVWAGRVASQPYALTLHHW
jgi:hypothetical protein